MSEKILISSMLLVMIVTAAHAGYRDLKRDFDTYNPPSYLQLRDKLPGKRVEPVTQGSFSAAKQAVEALKNRWEESLSTSTPVYSFFNPKPQTLHALRQATSDPFKAYEALKGKFSLEVLETLALLRNSGVKAAENRFRASIETFDQIINLDEILRQYTAFTEGLMAGVGPMKGKDPVAMKFPFPGVLALKGQIVNQEVKAAGADLESARREALTEARKTFWNLLFVYHAQKITKETIGLLNRLESVAIIRYEAGRTSFQDVIKIRIKRETLEEELVTFREKQQNLESKVREIADLPTRVKLGSPADHTPGSKLDLPIEPLNRLAQQRRRELGRLRARVGKMERMIEMAETMILPPYTLNLSLYEDRAVAKVGATAMQDAFQVSTKASHGPGLPKNPWYGTEDAYLRQTRQKLKALREELKKAESETTTMVRISWFKLDLANREAALYSDTVVNLSQAALEVSTRGYEAGNVSFADVIGSYNTWLNANLTLKRKQADVGIAKAELERTVGVSLNDGLENLLKDSK